MSSTEERADPLAGMDLPVRPSDLTHFQLSILRILAEEERYGLAIKRALERYYQKDVNHGRLYPNIDTLVNKGLVEKSELDRRTNNHALTAAGERVHRAFVDFHAQVEYDGGAGE